MQIETEFLETGDRPTVIVIERDQVVRSALHYILRDRYRTCAFASLDEALASDIDAPDIVLAGVSVLHGEDDRLPAALCKRYGGAAVLVVADRTSDLLAQLALERGAHGIVCKPISFDTVCGAVERTLAAPILRDAPSRLIRMAFG